MVAVFDMPPERRQASPFTLEEVARLATEVILEYGNHVPTLIAQGEHGPLLHQMDPFPHTHEGRRHWMYVTGMVMAQSGRLPDLKQVFFISEGWMSTASEDTPPVVPPSQDPDRIEVLFISGLEVEGHKADMVMYEMERNAEGRLVDLVPMPAPEGGDTQLESPLLDAFVEGYRTGMRSRVN
jgi:hypothetical protein